MANTVAHVHRQAGQVRSSTTCVCRSFHDARGRSAVRAQLICRKLSAVSYDPVSHSRHNTGDRSTSMVQTNTVFTVLSVLSILFFLCVLCRVEQSVDKVLCVDIVIFFTNPFFHSSSTCPPTGLTPRTLAIFCFFPGMSVLSLAPCAGLRWFLVSYLSAH